MPNTSSASAAANSAAARWADSAATKGPASNKYTPVHKRPTIPHASASNYSRSSSSSSSSGSRSSSPSPSTISSMSSAPPSPRSTSTKPSTAPTSPATSSRASSQSPPSSAKGSPKTRSKVPAITFQPGEPPVYTPSQLFSMRPLALESVKERMKNACPEVTMNRRMRKGLEFAAGAARRAARESASGSSTSASVSGSRTSSRGSSRGGMSSAASSSVASTSPSVTGSEFDVSESDAARFLEESILEDEEARNVVAAQAEEYIPPPAPGSFSAPPKRQPTGRKQALPRDLPDNSWRALKRLGVPVTAV